MCILQELCGDNGIDAREWIDEVTAEFDVHNKVTESFSRSVCYGQKENLTDALESGRTFIAKKMNIVQASENQ